MLIFLTDAVHSQGFFAQNLLKIQRLAKKPLEIGKKLQKSLKTLHKRSAQALFMQGSLRLTYNRGLRIEIHPWLHAASPSNPHLQNSSPSLSQNPTQKKPEI